MPDLCPDILAEFKKGFFVVRRTDTFWSGTSPDLCIEQTLMASLKGSTGLTHSRSLTQASRLVWVLSWPGILSIDAKIKEMSNLNSSEQNLKIKHTLPSTILRNTDDMDLLEAFFKVRFLLNLVSMNNTDKRVEEYCKWISFTFLSLGCKCQSVRGQNLSRNGWMLSSFLQI